jgi:hypothetical protein
MAEIEIGVFKRTSLKTRTSSKEELIERVKAYEQNKIGLSLSVLNSLN